jgi:hypothetical protein
MMNEQQIKKIKDGVEKYTDILKNYWLLNVAKDNNFQKKCNGFFRIIKRSPNWYFNYYEMLEDLKNNNKSFGKLLEEFKKKCNRIEVSFISKMCAIKNPKYPIIDQWILKNFKLKLPYSYDKKRLLKIIDIYDKLNVEYNLLLSIEKGKSYIKEFDTICPNCIISDIKKIDFILWQIR